MDLHIAPQGTLSGEVRVPGDKSISHRALILGAIAQGKTTIEGFLEGKDCLATLTAMRALGVSIDYQPEQKVTVTGVGLHGLQAPNHRIDCENSGTSMRLLAGLLAAQSFESELLGDNSLENRPMERIVTPLSMMGAKIQGTQIEDSIYPPLKINGQGPLNGVHYALPLASAQVKTSLLLAGLTAKEKIFLFENSPSRDHTERMLKVFGAQIEIKDTQIILTPGIELMGQAVKVPGDISSAAFIIAGASFCEGAHVLIKDVGVNPRRMGMIQILQQMGANIVLHHPRDWNGEPVADIEVKGSKLHGITVPIDWVASAIDEFPVIFVAAACAKGETIIRGVQELRFKETDRLATMAIGLKTLGVPLALLPDGIIIRGAPIEGGTVESGGDHRVAMAFAIAGLAAKQPIIVKECANIATSFPNFCTLSSQLGLSVQIVGE